MSRAKDLVERYRRGKVSKKILEATYWQLSTKSMVDNLINQLEKESSDENAVKIKEKLKAISDECQASYDKVTGKEDKDEHSQEVK